MKFVVVEHVNGKFSVQTVEEMGLGTLLDIDYDDEDEEEAKLACRAANEALRIAGEFEEEGDGLRIGRKPKGSKFSA